MNDRQQQEVENKLLTPVHSVALCIFCAVVTEVFLAGSLFKGNALNSVAIGRVIVIFLSLYSIHYFAQMSLSGYKPILRDFLFLTFVYCGGVITLGFWSVFSHALTEYAHRFEILTDANPNSMLYALPYGTGGLLLQSVLGIHYGLVFAVSFAIIVGLYFPSEPLLVPYTLALTFVACLSLVRFRSRSCYTRASFNLALAALPFVLASIIMGQGITGGDVVIRLAGAFVAGVLCGFIASGLTPVIEYIGGYVTDLRLIEMATLDHPLLKQLSVQAPGTWNHSMVMGMMAESAAEAIGANPIVARVGAYFHDIGKIKKPLYFVENQLIDENRHDKLSTSMSALIIRSHVKDGVELAHKYGVPKVIEEMIPQHHGTALIEYFYEKALKEAGESDAEEIVVDESLYRYPGPKPQTREAGILMLADGIEAATRTLSEPTADRVQGLVQKMINKVFSSGQLNECELTLNDLHSIAKSFTRVLNGIYHHRVAYAEPAEKVNERQQVAEVEVETTAAIPVLPKKSGKESVEKLDKEAKENLKRLGL